MKEYLGDSVYADVDTAGYLVLTTENGISVTHTIFLEPAVISLLIKYIETHFKRERGSQ